MKTAAGILLAFLVVAVFLVVAGCCTVCETIRYQPRPGADGIQHVDILAGSFFFQPNRIVLKAGVPVELSVRKAGRLVPHDIVASSPEAGIAFALQLAREPRKVAFTPTRPGTYPFFCSHRFLWITHRGQGMEGVFEVVE